MLNSVGVVGAGFMGSGIAEAVARGGIQATIVEPRQDCLEIGSPTAIERSVDRAVHAGRLSAEAARALLGRIAFTTKLASL